MYLRWWLEDFLVRIRQKGRWRENRKPKHNVVVDIRSRAEHAQKRHATKTETSSRRSIPIDMKPTRDRTSSPNAPLRLAPQPLQRALVLLYEWLQRLKALPIVLLDPRELVFREHRVADHLRLDGHDGEALEAEPDGTVELVLGGDAPDEEGRLDPDAEFAVGV